MLQINAVKVSKVVPFKLEFLHAVYTSKGLSASRLVSFVVVRLE